MVNSLNAVRDDHSQPQHTANLSDNKINGISFAPTYISSHSDLDKENLILKKRVCNVICVTACVLFVIGVYRLGQSNP